MSKSGTQTRDSVSNWIPDRELRVVVELDSSEEEDERLSWADEVEEMYAEHDEPPRGPGIW